MKHARIVCAALACAAFAWFVFHQARAIAFPFPLDYGEGPLLDQARQLSRGENIYHASLARSPFTIANYPPVFPSLLAIGPSYTIGRALTFVAALACMFHVSAIVRRVTASTVAAVVGPGFFAATPYVFFWAALVRVDFVALAFSLGAIAFASMKPTARSTPYVCAGLAFVAVMTRQSHLLAAPLALTAAFATQGWRRAAQFLVAFGVAVTIGVVTLQVTTHGFWFDIVTANANSFSWPLFRDNMIDVAKMLGVPMAIAIVALATQSTRERFTTRLLVTYGLGGALSALTIGKIGSNVNYLLELAAALSILVGIASARFSRESRASAFVNLVLAASILWLVRDGWLRTRDLDARLRLRAEYTELTNVIRAEKEPVIADEAMGLIVLTEHPLVLQPFELTQLAHQGLWDQTPLLDDIRNKKFGLVLINDTLATPAAWTRERWTEEMLAAIHQNYEPRGVLADATIYRPHPSE